MRQATRDMATPNARGSFGASPTENALQEGREFRGESSGDGLAIVVAFLFGVAEMLERFREMLFEKATNFGFGAQEDLVIVLPIGVLGDTRECDGNQSSASPRSSSA